MRIIYYICLKLFNMVTIYALINPFTGDPFYVGKTESIKYRLSMHSSDFMRRSSNKIKSYTMQRDNIIKGIREAGLKLNCIEILICSKKAAPKCEQHIYNLLTSNGFTLLQRKGCGSHNR